MAFKYADRVQDTTSTTGTGDLTLSGTPPTGYQTFNAGIGVGPQFAYCAYAGSEWEVGLTVLSGSTTLVRGGSQTVLASSTGSAISFSAGPKTVICTIPAARQPMGGQVFAGMLPDSSTISAGSSLYYKPNTWEVGGSTNHTYASLIAPRPGILRNIVLVLSNSQPGTGSLVATIRVNDVDTSCVLTIPASSGSGTYINTTTSADAVAGDMISIRVTNNASSSSAQIRRFAFSFD